ncbi:hypothetical protein NUH86_07250 [Sphingobium sp. JS3065]|uniref:hypothetical protein n=1 Tax=Sphingobium sp. JS3065 TaxID=2970925 RepID=UPI002263E5D1|nr:hypothetical protein [Sphingobium sp. JS3065]UZW56546.1 hypothetical protein NUH86_07250 [Sphingobium sp. JS3065]
MIEFESAVQNPRLFRKAVHWAMSNRDHIPSLSALAPKLTVNQAAELARSWQDAGFGRLIEVSEEGRRSVLFSLNQAALATSSVLDRRSLIGRLEAVPKSDWIALAAFVVSVIALFKPGS